MTKAIAIFSLVVIQIGCTLGNYWFTFGLWPRSWSWFMVFASGQIFVAWAIRAVTDSKE